MGCDASLSIQVDYWETVAGHVIHERNLHNIYGEQILMNLQYL